jgi:hypothetical protein
MLNVILSFQANEDCLLKFTITTENSLLHSVAMGQAIISE